MSARVWILAATLLCAAQNAVAQVYRWVDEKGTVHYSQSAPPPGVKAKLVDIEVKEGPPSPDSKECYTVRCQGERMEERIARREALDAKLAADRAANAPRPVHGLDFRKYVSIERGMTEGELLGIAGEPDFIADEGAVYDAPATAQIGRHTRSSASAALTVRTYTYMPTPADPFTTTITLVGGRVSDIERVRKF
ncbi:MAG TPA: DUF4124 domain-containing protein [Burkholderiales bacterium]|nr:DUF4124 domain-containing protein [Burkholderiales bacterium]